MRTLVLSISFFILTVSPFTCSSEMDKRGLDHQPNENANQHAFQMPDNDIDPIVMPKKP
jgi:hypothetical protein